MKEELIKHLPELAKIEAQNIVKFIDKEIRDKLDLETLDGMYYNKCIYGQMFGDCLYDEAREAMSQCCPKVEIGSSCVEPAETYSENIKKNRCTPLEAAIVCIPYYKHNDKLIEYLKQ